MLSPLASGLPPAVRAVLLCLAALALLVSGQWLAQSVSPSTSLGRLGGAAALLASSLGVVGWLWRPGHPRREATPDGLRFTTAQSLALQTRLLRGLPGPALLVRTSDAAPQPLACNAAAQATLPAAGTPALACMVQELLQRSRGGDSGVQSLELPGDCTLLWMPPSNPNPIQTPAPVPNPARPHAPALPAPKPEADDDRAAIVYTVSHDLRAPIRVIEGFTRIVREDYGHLLDRVGNDHLERVLGAATRMNSMIDSLLALSRLSTQTIERGPVDLSALAAQVVSELCAQSPERKTDIHIAPGLCAQGDAVLLRSVLDNLLGNAWKYASRREVTRIDFTATRTADGHTEFCLRDNGAGFDMRFAGKLFGAFQRLHGATEFPGTGIGLASVRRIVRRHGGDIRAEAAVNEGARFYFTLGSATDSAWSE
ncbi:sensor histidine kinase [Sphaerotilus sp.]|uniref:sensor histidine kinase n=1 Tax=Sphaerotilus sp. TaxID=2093942 RepID=UPI0025E90AE6|nr:ATP-binding protein [Sphaerotilus sp.]